MSRSHAGCQGLGKESDFLPASEKLSTGQEGDGRANSSGESVQGGGRSFPPGRVGMSTMWSLRNGASSTSPLGSHSILTTTPQRTLLSPPSPPQHNQSSERVCDEFKVTELEKLFLLTVKLFSLPENSAN